MLMKFALHRLKILRQHPIQLMFQIFVPVIFIVLLTYLQQAATDDFRVPIAVVDQDHSQYSQLVINRLQKNTAVRLVIDNRIHAESLLRQSKVDCIFILDKGFEQKIKAKEDNVISVIKTPMSLAYPLISEVVASQVLRLNSNVLAADNVADKYRELGIPAGQNLWSDAWRYTDSQWEPEPLMTIDYHEVVSNNVLDNKQNWLIQINRVIGWLLFILMLAAVFSANWLMDELKEGIIWRIQITKIKLYFYVFANSFPFLLFWSFDVIIIMLIVIPLYNVPLLAAVKLSLQLIMFVIFCWMLGIALASKIKSKGNFQLLTVFIALFTGIFTPQYWVLSSNFWVSFMVLFCFVGFLIFLSFWNFRRYYLG